MSSSATTESCVSLKSMEQCLPHFAQRTALRWVYDSNTPKATISYTTSWIWKITFAVLFVQQQDSRFTIPCLEEVLIKVRSPMNVGQKVRALETIVKCSTKLRNIVIRVTGMNSCHKNFDNFFKETCNFRCRNPWDSPDWIDGCLHLGFASLHSTCEVPKQKATNLMKGCQGAEAFLNAIQLKWK